VFLFEFLNPTMESPRIPDHMMQEFQEWMEANKKSRGSIRSNGIDENVGQDVPTTQKRPHPNDERDSASKLMPPPQQKPIQRPMHNGLASSNAKSNKPRPSKPLSGPKNSVSHGKKPASFASSPSKSDENRSPLVRSPKIPASTPNKISRPQVPATKENVQNPRNNSSSSAELAKSASQALNMLPAEIFYQPKTPDTFGRRFEQGRSNGGRHSSVTRPPRDSESRSATPDNVSRPRQTYKPARARDMDDDFEPIPSSMRTEIQSDLRARKSIPRFSNRPRPRYTTGEEEYVKSLEEEPPSSPEPLSPITYSDHPRQTIEGDGHVEVEEQDSPEPSPEPEPPRKFVIGIDYGTTFTSVSYIACSEETSTARVFPYEIGTIADWPDDLMGGSSRQVPTENWYSSIPIVRDPRTGHLEMSDSETDHDSDDDNDADIPRQPQRKRISSNFQVLRGSVPPSSSCRDNDNSSEFLWGYECPYQRYVAHSTRSKERHICTPKLMLLDTKQSKHTHESRSQLGPQLQHLIDKKLIRKHGKLGSLPGFRDVQDVITDFFVPILQHTRRELIKKERYTNECSVMFALTVPTIWSAKASRILQYALEEAMRITGFGTLTDRSVESLCVITEPKAAAAYLLGLGYAKDLRVSLLHVHESDWLT
jgi:hypothetical protein